MARQTTTKKEKPYPPRIRTVHPFPARMAPELVWEELPTGRRKLRVLDPMAGSGTTLVTAKLRGHEPIGYDRDPLAVLITRTWLRKQVPEDIATKAANLVKSARVEARGIKNGSSYPVGADAETKAFVRYWFDETNRKQLAALSRCIRRIRDATLRDYFWCAFSRLIITKKAGVSLAIDISHSRPHKGYEKAPINAFDKFESAVSRVVKANAFYDDSVRCSAGSIAFGDARKLPTRSSSVDVVITSPPYFNAIDYLRGHKFSLVWMGYTISALRSIRGTNVGAEICSDIDEGDIATEMTLRKMCSVKRLSKRHVGMLRRYVRDMSAVISETKRVLRPNGKAIFVVGNCNLKDTFVRNSKCVEQIAVQLGLVVKNTRRRPLPENRRYLPPPQRHSSGSNLTKRMREEVIITLVKPKTRYVQPKQPKKGNYTKQPV